MNRKEAAVAFLQMASAGEVEEAYARYIAADFVHHNPHFKGDRESLKAAMAEAHRMSPNKGFQVKRVFEDGDYVVTHSRVERSGPGEQDIAVVHIFRFEGEKVAEAWDLAQRLADGSPNEHGPF